MALTRSKSGAVPTAGKAGPDALLQTTAEGATELTEQQLDKVVGGKANKTNDKAGQAEDGYITGSR